MNTSLIIRRAEPRDVDTLADFACAMALETETKNLSKDTVSEGIRNLIAQPQYGFYLVAEHQQQTIGAFMVTFEWSEWRNGLFWWIQSVYIAPDFRRQGIYRQMYEHLQAESDKHPEVCGLRLYVEAENIKAQHTYKTLGMERTSYHLYERLK